MKKNEVVVNKKIIEDAINILKFESDRGFKCFKEEEAIINKLKQCIRNAENSTDYLSMIFYSDHWVICDIDILRQTRDLIRKRFYEYHYLAQEDVIRNNKKILVEIKNRRDQFGAEELSNVIKNYDNKYKNIKELSIVLKENESVILHILHSSNFFTNNEIKIEIPTSDIRITDEHIIIGNELTPFSLESGIYCEFDMNNLETIEKNDLIIGYDQLTLHFYNHQSISILFKEKRLQKRLG